MKLKAVARTSLALGMLATGVITSNVQSVQVKAEVKQQNEPELKHYYNKPILERKNVTGFKYTGEGKHYLEIIARQQHSRTTLLGSDKDKFKDKENPNTDVSILREGDNGQATDYSIGGVTKSSNAQYVGYINTPILEIKKDNEDVLKDFYYISKEDISLKELDYRLRGRTIKQHGLYSDGLKQGRITVTVNDGATHTIGLSQRLERERIGESIDGAKINKILVEMKQYSLATKRYVE